MTTTAAVPLTALETATRRWGTAAVLRSSPRMSGSVRSTPARRLVLAGRIGPRRPFPRVTEQRRDVSAYRLER